VNFEDIYNEIKDAANEKTGTDSGRFTDAQYLRKANMVMREICIETECLQSSAVADSVADQLEYSKSSDTAKIKRIEVKGASDADYSAVVPVSMETLDSWEQRGIITRPWRDQTADKPSYWYTRGEVYGFHPKFSAAITSGIQVFYEEQPTEMTATTDVPFNTDTTLYGYHRLIVYGVLANIAPTLGLDTKYWSEKYENGKAQMKNKLESDDEDILTFSLDRPAVQIEASDIEEWYKE